MTFSVGLGSAASSRSTKSTNCSRSSQPCAAWSPTRNPGAAVLRDKKDDYLVFLARAVGAQCTVSGDADLTDALLDPPALTPYRAA